MKTKLQTHHKTVEVLPAPREYIQVAAHKILALLSYHVD